MNERKLAARILECGYTIGGFCKTVGISYHAFYNKTHGVTSFTTAEVDKIADVLDLESPEIINIFFPKYAPYLGRIQ